MSKQKAVLSGISIAGILLFLLAMNQVFGSLSLSLNYKKWLEEEVVYIITPEEKEVFSKLKTNREKDIFIESFWKHCDPTPSTPENEFKTEHYRRISFANEKFSTNSTPGWKTEAGRRYILLGDASGKSGEKLMLMKPVEWNMKMRILEGVKEGVAELVKAITASYLKYNISASIQTEFDLAEERLQIKKTFNLKDVRLLTEADFRWTKSEPEKTFHIFRLDSKEYLILITAVEPIAKQQFRIEVFEQSDKERKNLLDTEFSIPKKSITVFGFEDAQGKPYFLSFRLAGWTAETEKGFISVSVPSKEPKGLPKYAVKAAGKVKPPKLIHKVDPAYPEEARKAKVEGIVILEAETDIYGKIKNIRILKSVPLLDQAAIDAVKQWVYEPAVIEGRPRGLIFTVTVKFSLKKDEKAPSEEKKDVLRITSDIGMPKFIKKVDPLYPEIAKQAKVEGRVILAVELDTGGLVKDVKVLKSIPLLDQAAIDAVKQWKFEPVIVDGKPIAFVFTVTITFDLKRDQIKGIIGGVAGGVEGGVEGGVVGGVMGGVIGWEDKTGEPAVRIESNLVQPKKIKHVDPVYPEEARKAGTEGEVVLEVITDTQGRVASVIVIKSVPELDQAAMDAVRQWKYEPLLIDGKLRRAIFTVTVSFRLD